MKRSLSSTQFKSVLNNSTIKTINNLQFYYCASSEPKIGFIVSKKLGSSVERNRFKRKCRNLFLGVSVDLNKKFSLIVWPKKPLCDIVDIANSFSLLNKKVFNV